MLRNLSLLVPFLLLVHVTSAAALPPCSGKYHDPCFGVYLWPDGAKYVGEYKDGIQDGYGIMFWADGGVWVGQWKSDKWLGGEKYTKGEVPPDIMALFHKD